jgi:hypothetical protein
LGEQRISRPLISMLEKCYEAEFVDATTCSIEVRGGIATLFRRPRLGAYQIGLSIVPYAIPLPVFLVEKHGDTNLIV